MNFSKRLSHFAWSKQLRQRPHMHLTNGCRRLRNGLFAWPRRPASGVAVNDMHTTISWRRAGSEVLISGLVAAHAWGGGINQR
jgi:hypothetical protein